MYKSMKISHKIIKYVQVRIFDAFCDDSKKYGNVHYVSMCNVITFRNIFISKVNAIGERSSITCSSNGKPVFNNKVNLHYDSEEIMQIVIAGNRGRNNTYIHSFD